VLRLTAPPPISPSPPLPPQLQSLSWKAAYIHRYLEETRKCCPKPGCEGAIVAGAVVPVIYGFPTTELIEAMRQRKVVIGADHIPVDDWKMAIWGCTIGRHTWKEYPWL